MLGCPKKSKSVPALVFGKFCVKKFAMKVACSRNRQPAGVLNIGSPALPKFVDRAVFEPPNTFCAETSFRKVW